jgi:Tfp pilus assembly protein PilF
MIRLAQNCKFFLMSMLFLFGSACSLLPLDIGFSDDGNFESSILNQSADAYPEINILALDQEIIDYIEVNVTDRSSAAEIVNRLQALLFDAQYLNLQYNDQRTRTAIETFHSREGNCLSVVSLYIAMARYLGVDAQFQTVEVRPTWDRRGELLVLNQHINATGVLGKSSYYIVDFTPEISLQQLTASAVGDTHARALYFNNLGVESLILEDYESALRYFKNALWVDPGLSIAWNNIGTAYNRSGESDLAEYSYRKAYSVDRGNATAINNLVKFYNANGEVETAARYARAIRRFNMSNPYYHYNLGSIAFADAEFDQARQHFIRAIRRKDAEPDFYLALSRTYEELGDEEQSQQMLQMARMTVLANSQIYLPSDNKVRVVDEAAIPSTGSYIRNSAFRTR